MKILCDHMLGSLAKWLRILGFDTLYPTAQMSDDELLRITKQDHRLIISRDKELIVRGKKASIEVIEVHTTDLNEQLRQILSQISVDTAHLLTRCTLCNTVLLPTEKKTVKDQVPPKVFENKEEFWYCPECKKYYWMGTHYENMMQKITALTQEKNKV